MSSMAFNRKVPAFVPGRKGKLRLLKQMVCAGSSRRQGYKDRLILHYERPSESV